ncbi:MAG: hypothetical protein FWE03_06525 [Firmicutes bacterium]|nr:hypothetical protein [Bacillota bacterium]
MKKLLIGIITIIIISTAFMFVACDNNVSDISPPRALNNPNAMAEYLRNNNWEEAANIPYFE